MTDFWHNKRVLVTGGNGFLGTYVVRSFDCPVRSAQGLRAQERERGAAEIIPSALLRAGSRSSQCDPRDISITAIRRALSDAKPQMVQ